MSKKKKPQRSHESYCEIGMRINEIMIEKNMTRSQICEKADIGDKTFRNWLYGDAEPSLFNLQKLCYALGCSSDFILGIISRPNHELSNIHDVTGLDDIAITALKVLKQGSTEHAPFTDYISKLLCFSEQHDDNPYFLECASNTFSIIGTILNDTISEKEVKNMIIAGLKLQAQQAFMNFTDDYISYSVEMHSFKNQENSCPQI